MDNGHIPGGPGNAIDTNDAVGDTGDIARSAMARPTLTGAAIEPQRRFSRYLLTAAVLATAITVPIAGFLVPADALQGEAQRLMYIHVPAAWTAYVCFTVVLFANVQVLRTAAPRYEWLATSAAEVGVLFTTVTLVSGSVWGALTWGTWWAWDARVTTTVAMGLVYVIYLTVADLAVGRRGRMLASTIGIAGFVMVPMVHFSVLWWRTLHQPATILTPDSGRPIDGSMFATLILAIITATLWAGYVVVRRCRTQQRADGTPAQRSADRVGALT